MKSTKMLVILVMALGLIVYVAKVSEAEPDVGEAVPDVTEAVPEVDEAAAAAEPMGTAITYQGSLNDAGSPADGLYDFQFKLFDDSSTVTGDQVGSTIDINDLDVIEGYFTVELDFGIDVFAGEARWLETTVAQSDGSDPCTLTPRVELTPTPYAIYAEKAGAAHSLDAADGAPTDVVYVSSLGNVGIGTTNPTQKLDVVGNVTASRYYDSSNTSYYMDPASTGTSAKFAGRVGIGTANPICELDVVDGSMRVEGTDQYTLRVSNNAIAPGASYWAGWFRSDVEGASTSFAVSGNAVGASDKNVGGYFAASGGTENFAIWSNTGENYFDGNVGIGTNSPTEKLEVAGNEKVTGDLRVGGRYFDSSSDAGIGGQILSSTGTGTNWINPPSGGDSDWIILGNNMYSGVSGNVGIGTTSPLAGLHLKATGYPSSFMYLQSDEDEDTGFRLYEGTTVKWHIFNNSLDDSLEIRNNAYSPVLIAEQSTGKVNVRVLGITGGSDLSEQFEVSDEDGKVKPGMVVCIDATNPGNLVVSKESYDRTVAGIVSGAGGIKPGMLMGQKGTEADGDHPVALTGRVYCRADASNGSIEPGDLLTTSDIPGHAMKVTDYVKAQGAILGKAMSSLKSGKGLVLVLVSLQ